MVVLMSWKRPSLKCVHRRIQLLVVLFEVAQSWCPQLRRLTWVALIWNILWCSKVVKWCFWLFLEYKFFFFLFNLTCNFLILLFISGTTHWNPLSKLFKTITVVTLKCGRSRSGVCDGWLFILLGCIVISSRCLKLK